MAYRKNDPRRQPIDRKDIPKGKPKNGDKEGGDERRVNGPAPIGCGAVVASPRDRDDKEKPTVTVTDYERAYEPTRCKVGRCDQPTSNHEGKDHQRRLLNEVGVQPYWRGHKKATFQLVETAAHPDDRWELGATIIDSDRALSQLSIMLTTEQWRAVRDTIDQFLGEHDG